MTRNFRGALLFDIDGTLTDTDPLHIQAFNMMLGQFGRSITPPEYFARVMGFTNAEIMRNFFPEKSVDEHKALADWKEASESSQNKAFTQLLALWS
jgi:beta-phosphoglucomutase-like phosphatase (HAD superfamily)